jgi:hypothetical protein
LRARHSARHGARDEQRANGSSLAIQAASMAREAPHLLRPQHVAALQASAGNRTVQGLFGRGRKSKAGPSPLTWKDTQWANTRFLGASSEGSGGVLFAGARGKEVVVKPGETMDVEGGIASYLVSQAARAGGNGLGLAPGYRLASAAEARQMEQAFKGLVPAAGKEKRVATLVGKLSGGGVVVQDMAQGKPLNKALDDVPKHTKKRLFGGGRKLRSTSPMRIFTDVRAIRAFGSVHAADMLMGNDDRLTGFNAENVMVSPTSLQMIDHVMEQADKTHLRTFTVGKGKFAKKQTVDSVFADWKAHPNIQQLATGKYDQIAATIFQELVKKAPELLSYDELLAGGKARHRGRDVDRDATRQILEDNRDRFEAVFAAGLEAGRAQVIRSLNKLLQIPGMLEDMAGGGDVTEVRRALTLRRDFIRDGS